MDIVLKRRISEAKPYISYSHSENTLSVQQENMFLYCGTLMINVHVFQKQFTLFIRVPMKHKL